MLREFLRGRFWCRALAVIASTLSLTESYRLGPADVAFPSQHLFKASRFSSRMGSQGTPRRATRAHWAMEEGSRSKEEGPAAEEIESAEEESLEDGNGQDNTDSLSDYLSIGELQKEAFESETDTSNPRPFPGPPIPEFHGGLLAKQPPVIPDNRPWFALFSRLASKKEPNEPMQAAYIKWLGHSGIDICKAYYMSDPTAIMECWETGYGFELSEKEMEAKNREKDAQQQEQETQAREAAAAAGVDFDSVAGQAFLPRNRPAMIENDLKFLLGHLTIGRARSPASVATWADADPIVADGGYEASNLHEWVRSSEPELNVNIESEGTLPLAQSEYAVHCIDRDDAGDLRASTREKHLQWLRESGRVCMCGPLIDPGDSDEGKRVGSLLIVKGDEISEVKEWAATDPYAKAGLFACTHIGQLSEFAWWGRGTEE